MFFSSRAGVSVASFAALLLATSAAYASPSEVKAPLVKYVPGGMIITPRSSQDAPGKKGIEMHTNTRIFARNGASPFATSPTGTGETPASMACIYGVVTPVSGCKQSLTKVSTLGSKAVAIVDAYDYPNAMADLNVYSKQYGLPPVTASTFKVAYGSGTKPGVDSSGGWELEEALDIEMVHAMAPNAVIYLVEATSNSTANLLAAEKVAGKLVAAAGGGEVTNSWGGGESSNEANMETDFVGTDVVYFASAGDSNGTEFPSVLPNVVGVGGTSIERTGGSYTKQETWSDTGGGLSSYIARPKFQKVVKKIVGKVRGVPDIGAIANPDTGPWMYDTNPYEGEVLKWLVIGGTSVASPVSAGIVNAAAGFNATTTAELTEIYSGLGGANWYDVTLGSCGNAKSGSAGVGYDLCTGVGAPLGLAGK